MDLPLRPDIVLMAQCCRSLFCKTDAPTPEARRLSFRRRSAGRHQPLRKGAQSRTEAIHLESRPSRHHCCRKAWAPNVGITPLARPTGKPHDSAALSLSSRTKPMKRENPRASQWRSTVVAHVSSGLLANSYIRRFNRILLRCEKTRRNFASFVALAAGFNFLKFVHTTKSNRSLRRGVALFE